jgi:large subunit ribosomal protein L4
LLRRGTASTLTRAEVRGGGKKPFAQKGTGQARRGSKRSPLIVGGGVAFGPKPRDWSIKMNKKERRLAMATALQTAAPSITVVEDLTAAQFPERKTKAVAAALSRWGVGPEEHALLITKEVVETVEVSARNLARLVHSPVSALSVYDILRADKLIVEASALEHLNSWFGEEGAAWA